MVQHRTFGQIAKKLRQARGMTQAELSQKIRDKGKGITQSYISRVEQGNRIPGGRVLAVYANALDVPSDVLLGLQDIPPDVLDQPDGDPEMDRAYV